MEAKRSKSNTYPLYSLAELLGRNLYKPQVIKQKRREYKPYTWLLQVIGELILQQRSCIKIDIHWSDKKLLFPHKKVIKSL